MGIKIDVHVVIKDIVSMILDNVVKRNVSWNQHIQCFITTDYYFFKKLYPLALISCTLSLIY